jgi:hypothetical protein
VSHRKRCRQSREQTPSYRDHPHREHDPGLDDIEVGAGYAGAANGRATAQFTRPLVRDQMDDALGDRYRVVRETLAVPADQGHIDGGTSRARPGW